MSRSQLIFSLSAIYAVYIIAVYPLLLSWLARHWPMKVKQASLVPPVSIIVAVHNGAAFVRDKLDSIFALEYPASRMQVILADDGSNDQTVHLARTYPRPVTVLSIQKSGKAAALNRAVSIATGDFLVFTDIRQRLAPDSLSVLMENFADPRVGSASAELEILSGASSEEENIGSYWRYERWIRLNLSSVDSIFGASGSYYVIRRELAIPIPPNTLLDDMYLPLHAFFRGYRLIVDRRAKMFDFPTNLASEFGRKVRTLAGNYQILRAYPQLLGPKNRLWLHFMSYKFGRLLLPFALMTAAVASVVAGGWLAILSAVVQVIVCAAALLDPAIAEHSMWKRLTSPIRIFVVMMLATICAISIWFVPPERLWRKTRVVRPEIAA